MGIDTPVAQRAQRDAILERVPRAQVVRMDVVRAAALHTAPAIARLDRTGPVVMRAPVPIG
jgi:hypothetical protein